jgi:hypothetical protein
MGDPSFWYSTHDYLSLSRKIAKKSGLNAANHNYIQAFSCVKRINDLFSNSPCFAHLLYGGAWLFL